jgi:hypothetical protein
VTPDLIFTWANGVALAAWVLLAALPARRWVTAFVAGTAVPALFAVAYIAILAVQWRGSAGGFSSLAAVAALFGNPWMLLAGWVHYLAFDLLIGSWEVGDARERGIPHLWVVPCLGLTFLFGPAGWLLYVAVRATHARGAPSRRPIRVRP